MSSVSLVSSILKWVYFPTIVRRLEQQSKWNDSDGWKLIHITLAFDIAKKEPFFFFWLTATCNCWTLFWLFHSIRCWLVLLVPWKTIYKNNASVCSFNVIWNNFLKLRCRCIINAAISVGKITCYLLLFLPFQFIPQMRAFPKLRESFLSVAQLCYWYHENREWRHFILQKKEMKKMTFSTTNKSRFFI